MPCSRNCRRRELFAGAAALLAPLEESILVHEHVLVDFIGADKIVPGRYSLDEVFRIARPRLEEVRRMGCSRLQEATPNFLGRDPRLLARLADAAGIEIWTNTGLYGAGNHRFLPQFASAESAERLARRWIAEARQGWGGVRPRFIKTGVGSGPLHPLDRKLVRAAAITSRETGLAIASHTGDGSAALEQIQIIAQEKLSASKFVWVHAQNEKNHELHEKVARAGAWVEFDGIGPKTAAFHLECVRFMAGKNLLHRTLISQDAGWYHVGEPGGGQYRGYTFIYTDFVPLLEPGWARQLLIGNPRKAFG
ncbi:MAG: phosphotriesterase [Acidobacteria bacterium]|nr:phosphotriesterase [Acidobacteriota bacterium]